MSIITEAAAVCWFARPSKIVIVSPASPLFAVWNTTSLLATVVFLINLNLPSLSMPAVTGFVQAIEVSPGGSVASRASGVTGVLAQ